MPFDGFVTAAVCKEINDRLAGGRIDKVIQPTEEELCLTVRSRDRQNYRLILSASSNIPRVHITSRAISGPAVPGAMCMQLRGHLCGAVIIEAVQPDFDRVVKLVLSGSDDMGFRRSEALIGEIMGKCSNVALVSLDTGKVVNAVRYAAPGSGAKRLILPGMTYEAPPAQDKLDPLKMTREDFDRLIEAFGGEDGDKFALKCIKGFSPLMSRELGFRAGASGIAVRERAKQVYEELCSFVNRARQGDFAPCTVSENGRLIDYCAFEITQYGKGFDVKSYDSIGECIDTFYYEKENKERLQRRAGDVMRLVHNIDARIRKKIENQQRDLAATEEMDTWRLYGDLITANIWQIREGACHVTLDNYYQDGKKETIPLDSRLSPSRNAQKYYKKYSKAKTAKKELENRINMSRQELAYISTVYDALTRSETEEDITEIREELYKTGYASKAKQQASRPGKNKPLKLQTDGGYTVYVGKNNLQNEELTLKKSAPCDWFFHVKNAPGSHVVMVCDPGEDPPAEDFTQAGMIAAYYSSKRDGSHVEVDYTLIKNVKKPPASPPGLVIYKTNYSMTVTPDREKVEKLISKA